MSNYAEYLRHLANGRMEKSQAGLEDIADHLEALEARVKELSEAVVRVAEQRDEQERIAISNFEECSKMSAELERLKAQEPAGYQYRYNDGDKFVGEWKTVDSQAECNPDKAYENRVIYTAARPAAAVPVKVPEKINWRDIDCELTDFGKALAAVWYNQAIQDVLSLNDGAEVKS